MIAKLIAWGETREDAIDQLRDGIDGTEVWPVKTNAGFLGRLVDLDEFRLGDVDTGLIAREVDDLVHPSEPEHEELLEAAALLCASPGEGPVSAILGFRLNAPPLAEARLRDDAGNLYVVAFDEIEADEPMPGRIIAVDVAVGDTVSKGQKLVTLEAMKMEHSLTAPFDGVVAELNAETGAQVQVEALLVRIAVVEV